MSPRAACRLELLGFERVFDYSSGKADWLAAGLPTVRADVSERRAVDALVTDLQTCAPDADLSTLPAAGSVIVTVNGIVVGRVGVGQERRAGMRADRVMHPGPMTVRAHEPLDPLLERMAKRHVSEVLVTTPEGRLLGAVHRTVD